MDKEFLKELGIEDEKSDKILEKYNTITSENLLKFNDLQSSFDNIKKENETYINKFKELENLPSKTKELEEIIIQKDNEFNLLKADNEKIIYNTNVDKLFNNYKFSNDFSRKGIINEFDKKGFKFDNGEFLGAKEWIETLQKDEKNKNAFILEDNLPKKRTGVNIDNDVVVEPKELRDSVEAHLKKII